MWTVSIIWAIRIVLAAVFLYEGVTKCTKQTFQHDFFVQYLRYPEGFLRPFGAFEIVAATLCVTNPSVGLVMIHFDMGMFAHAVFFRVRLIYLQIVTDRSIRPSRLLRY